MGIISFVFYLKKKIPLSWEKVNDGLENRVPGTAHRPFPTIIMQLFRGR
jgi:hypothetical protein